MNSKVQPVYRNLRYRLLHVNDKNYIVDADQPSFVFIFPFIYWLLPLKVYVIEDEEIINALKVPIANQVKGKVSPFLGAGISVLIANLIRPLMDYFDISSTWMINSIIVCLLFSSAFYLRFLVSKLFKNNLQKTVNLAELPTKTMRIHPVSIVHVLKFMGGYCLFAILILATVYSFLAHINTLILLFTFILFCILLIFNVFALLLADYKVTFVDKQYK